MNPLRVGPWSRSDPSFAPDTNILSDANTFLKQKLSDSGLEAAIEWVRDLLSKYRTAAFLMLSLLGTYMTYYYSVSEEEATWRADKIWKLHFGDKGILIFLHELLETSVFFYIAKHVYTSFLS